MNMVFNMIGYLKSVLSNFKPMSSADRAYKYLSESYDLVDLERRMRELEKSNFKF